MGIYNLIGPQFWGKPSCSGKQVAIKIYANLGLAYEFLVSKETVVLRRWERSKQKFGFIKRVDKG